MAFGGLLVVLDDLAIGARKVATMAAATSLDDVAMMAAGGTKAAAGVVVDDMAVTAASMSGLHRDRESSFVWQVAKGSMKNKMYYLVPGAMVINLTIPALMTPILVAGGFFLAYEGAEKVWHTLRHQPHHDPAHDNIVARARTPEEVLAFEEQLVRDAIKTDFILSAEIIAISLASMQAMFSNPLTQAVALPVAAAVMTIAVYGAVWGLVKIDDFGEWLHRHGVRRSDVLLQNCGKRIIASAPGLFKVIGAVGTFAMLAVGGELILHGLHGVPGIESGLHTMAHAIKQALPGIGGFVAGLAEYALAALLALGAGAVLIVTKLPEKLAHASSKCVHLLTSLLRRPG